jgi:CDP-2,3-bis-(O-geranylgeranyl)-sn-glycerol synthase
LTITVTIAALKFSGYFTRGAKPGMSLCVYCLFQALILLVVANGAPVIVGKVLGDRWARPIDNGLNLSDGHRLFGDSKTWRGLFSSVFFTTAMAQLFGIHPLIGVWFGMLSMTGDILASFVKRRLGKVESSRARGLDTVPESLLPLCLLTEPLALNFMDITLIVAGFFLMEEFVSPVLYRLNIRNRPY